MSNTPNPSPPDTDDWMTRARYLVYGTAASLLELLEDPEKRAEQLKTLSLEDLEALTNELVAKGQMTEQEALQYVEQARQEPQPPQNPDQPSGSSAQTAAPPASADPTAVASEPVNRPIQQPSGPSSSPTTPPSQSTGSPSAGSPQPTGSQPTGSQPTGSQPTGSSASASASGSVSQDDIRTLMGLTRQIEQLRMDMERMRTDPDPHQS